MGDLHNKNQNSYPLQKKKLEVAREKDLITKESLLLKKRETLNEIEKYDVQVAELDERIDMKNKQIAWLDSKIEEQNGG